MPRFLEEKLKKEYGKDSDIPYKIMNKLGFMHGNKETKKGKAAEAKHAKGIPGEHTKEKEVKEIKAKMKIDPLADEKDVGQKLDTKSKSRMLKKFCA